METISSLHPQPDSSANAHSTFKTVGAVLAALVTWIFVATVLNLPLRTSWPHYHEAETAFNFTLAMKLARLALGARLFPRGRICRRMDWKGPDASGHAHWSRITWSFHS